MATRYIAPNGELPTHVETFEYEAGVFVLQATFKLASGSSLRLDFYDFSDFHEFSNAGACADSVPQHIKEFVYEKYPENGMYSWVMHTDTFLRIWNSEFPVGSSKVETAKAEARRIERDRKYRFRRMFSWLFDWKMRRLALSRVSQFIGEKSEVSSAVSAPIDLAYNEANHLLNRGITAQEANKLDQAERHYKRSLELYATHKDNLTWAKGHHQMGNVNIERKQWDSARRWHLRSLELCRRHGLQQLEASSLYWLGHIALRTDSDDCGFGLFEESAEASRRATSSSDLANALYGMGTARMFKMQFHEAMPHLEAALKAEEAIAHNMMRQLQCLSGMVNCSVLMGDFDGATRTARKAEALAEKRNTEKASREVRDMFAAIQEARDNPER